MANVDSVEIELIEPPVAGLAPLALLWHKGSPWIDDIGNRLRGHSGESRDYFFIARIGGQMVAHVWYTVATNNRQVGLLGHVFCQADFRRQGIATRLLETALANFDRQGGRLLQLFTYNPATVRFYERFGFEVVGSQPAAHGMDWAMRRPGDAMARVDDRFASRECQVRTLTAGDLPEYCLLYNIDYATRLKDWPQQIGVGLESELAYITTRAQIDRRRGICLALTNNQTIVGIGTLFGSQFAHQRHLGAVDYYVHPSFSDQAGSLLRACLDHRAELGLDVVYAVCVDSQKRATFVDQGFTYQTVLADHFRVADQGFACSVYRVDEVVPNLSRRR
jgi:GNAT superfamily N-acetyltransferase